MNIRILNAKTFLTLACAVVIALAFIPASAQLIKLPGNVKTPAPTPKPPLTVAVTGPSAETAAQFRKDAQAYSTAINQLYGYENVKEWDPRPNATGLKETLDQAAALAEIIRTKYPGIENGARCSQFDCKYGEWRRLAENRVQVVQTYLSKSFAFSMKDGVKDLNRIKDELKIKQGFVLSPHFDDKAARIPLDDTWKAKFALVGLKTPDESVMTDYNAAYDALIAAAKLEAPNWVFPSPYHDAMIEGKARGWFKTWDPKGTIVKIGTFHNAWEVTKLANGLPNGRYKRGYILYRKPGVDGCITVGFSYEQNYIGGGRYNDMAVTSGMHQIVRLQGCDK